MYTRTNSLSHTDVTFVSLGIVFKTMQNLHVVRVENAAVLEYEIMVLKGKSTNFQYFDW